MFAGSAARPAHLVLRRTASTLVVPTGVAGFFFGDFRGALAWTGFRRLKRITVSETMANPRVAGRKSWWEDRSFQASFARSRYSAYASIFGKY